MGYVLHCVRIVVITISGKTLDSKSYTILTKRQLEPILE